MKRNSRAILITMFMLFSTAMLILPLQLAAQGKTYCQQCAEDCVNDAWWAKMECMRGGGSETECNQTYSSTLNSCNAVFCNYGGGCNLPTNH